jgi:hypothetical protein
MHELARPTLLTPGQPVDDEWEETLVSLGNGRTLKVRCSVEEDPDDADQRPSQRRPTYQETLGGIVAMLPRCDLNIHPASGQ